MNLLIGTFVNGEPFRVSLLFEEKLIENSNLMGNVYYHLKEQPLAFSF